MTIYSIVVSSYTEHISYIILYVVANLDQ